MILPIVFHPDYLIPLNPRLAWPMGKPGYLRSALATRGLLPADGFTFTPAPLSTTRAATVHALAYVERVANLTLTPAETRAIGLPNTEAVARRAFLSAAGTLLAARLALDHGMGFNLAGGSHHAGPDAGAGYCVFNDVAIAARTLLDEGAVSRVLVLDLDVHQGDGTARIFANTQEVLTLSLHAERNYPARKATSDLDYPLPDSLADRPYLETLAHALAATEPFRPDLVFYNAGVDPHRDDRLGRLALTDAGLRARDALVLNWARARALPLAGVLGGGYDDDPVRLANRHAILFEEAARVFS